MDAEFAEMVGAALGDFLLSQGFRFDEYLDLECSGRSVVIYLSPLCRLLSIYYSEIDDKINCMVGRGAALNADLDRENEWSYFRWLLDEDKNLSIKELLARAPGVPRNGAEQLSEIASISRLHFEEIVKALQPK